MTTLNLEKRYQGFFPIVIEDLTVIVFPRWPIVEVARDDSRIIVSQSERCLSPVRVSVVTKETKTTTKGTTL